MKNSGVLLFLLVSNVFLVTLRAASQWTDSLEFKEEEGSNEKDPSHALRLQRIMLTSALATSTVEGEEEMDGTLAEDRMRPASQSYFVQGSNMASMSAVIECKLALDNAINLHSQTLFGVQEIALNLENAEKEEQWLNAIQEGFSAIARAKLISDSLDGEKPMLKSILKERRLEAEALINSHRDWIITKGDPSMLQQYDLTYGKVWDRNESRKWTTKRSRSAPHEHLDASATSDRSNQLLSKHGHRQHHRSKSIRGSHVLEETRHVFYNPDGSAVTMSSWASKPVDWASSAHASVLSDPPRPIQVLTSIPPQLQEQAETHLMDNSFPRPSSPEPWMIPAPASTFGSVPDAQRSKSSSRAAKFGHSVVPFPDSDDVAVQAEKSRCQGCILL